MKCPSCAMTVSKVIDSRTAQNGASIRRRRECEECGARFTTYERIEDKPLPMIAKIDGRREAYSRDKLVQGLLIACRKRPVSIETVEALADDVERDLAATGKREVTSAFVGDRVMAGLRPVDKIAFIRFASVYQSIEDLESFSQLLDSLKSPNQDA